MSSNNIITTSTAPLYGKTTTAQSSPEEKQLRQVCADFEAIFIYQLLKSMKKLVPEGGLLPMTTGRSMWEDMLHQQIAEAVSRRGNGLGLQTMLYRELQKKLKNSEQPPITNTNKSDEVRIR